MFATQVAETAGIALKHVTDPHDAALLVEQDDPGIVFVDGSTEELHQAFEKAIQSKIGLFSDKVRPNSIHFLSNSEINQATFLVHSPILGSFLTRDRKNMKESGAHYGRIIRMSFRERAFGLEHFFEGKAEVQILTLEHASQKPELLDTMKLFLSEAKFSPRAISGITTAIDELMMNAIYDAPTDELGSQIYTTTPRTENIELKGKNAVTVGVGFDGDYLGVCITDFFGSLDKGKLMAHISREYVDSEYKLKPNVAGAGIGLATIHQSGGSLLFVSETRTRTEVTAFFRRVESYKEYKKQFRFISTQFYF